MSGVWQRKDLLSLRELNVGEIGKVLSTATVFKEILGRPIKKVPSLQGRTVVNLFIEPSTRTRISFEFAILPNSIYRSIADFKSFSFISFRKLLYSDSKKCFNSELGIF